MGGFRAGQLHDSVGVRTIPGSREEVELEGGTSEEVSRQPRPGLEAGT